jgi:hypothetical protein
VVNSLFVVNLSAYQSYLLHITTLVGVVLQGKLLVGLADIVLVGIFRYTKDFVQLVVVDGSSTASSATSATTSSTSTAVHTSKVLKGIATTKKHFLGFEVFRTLTETGVFERFSWPRSFETFWKFSDQYALM